MSLPENTTNNIESKGKRCEKVSILNLNHFSDIIKSLFDMYKRYPNGKTGKIIKQTFQDYTTVISFIQNEALYNNTYESVIESIYNKFGERIKTITKTEELKNYFEISRNSNELFNKYKDPKKILQILGVDSSQLTGNITAICEEGILCFFCDDHDMSILCEVETGKQIPNGCLTKKSAKYKDNFLPIILLRKDNPDIDGTKAHEVQHHINNILFMKDNGVIDKDNIEEIIGLKFKDEIIAQAIHGTKVITSDGEETNEAITFYNDIDNPDSYDFPFLSLQELIFNHNKKQGGEEIDRSAVGLYIKQNDTLRKWYNHIRGNLYEDKFWLRDKLLFARNMQKSVEGANFILALTPFDNWDNLKDIYLEELQSV